MNRLLTGAVLIAAMGLSACTNPNRFGAGGADGANGGLPAGSTIDQAGLGGPSDPTSPQYFSQTIGDRVLFSVDQFTLTPQGMATLDGQAQWLLTNSDYLAVIEGHADEQGTREYNVALGRSPRQFGPRLPDLEGCPVEPVAHGELWQGAPGRGLFGRVLLFAEPPRGDDHLDRVAELTSETRA
jgi:hypothetical protein